MKRIKYITKYDLDNSKDGRVYNLSTKNLDDYIFSALKKEGWKIDVISPTISGNDSGYYPKQIKHIGDSIKILLFRTFGGKTKLTKSFSKLLSMSDLLIFLLLKAKKDEPIIVRHSLIFTLPVYISKKIKGYKLILNFGEEYNKVRKGNIIYQWLEPKVIKSAEKFIFSNDMMGESYNVEPYNYTVLYGQYSIDRELKYFNKINDKIHLVYAGIISKEEKSAFRAIELANFLNSNYVIHILGKVEHSSREDFFLEVERANKKNGGCKIIYEGLKSGMEYINEMEKYDIGLNFRDVDAGYIDFAFPSKVLSYLNLGLRVVTSEIKCLKKSQVSDLLYYCNEKNMKQAAEVIKKIDLSNEYNPSTRLKRLDEEFRKSIKCNILS